MPEIEHPPLAPQKARAEHRVRLSLENRAQQSAVLLRIVFQVGVLDDDHVSVAASIPRRMAAPFPRFWGWPITRSTRPSALSCSKISPLPSVERSSTAI